MIAKTPEQAGGALNRTGTLGWMFVVVDDVLNENFMARLECGAPQ